MVRSGAIVKGVNYTVAGGGLALPWWHTLLEEVSSGAALVMPILGAAWLLTQIIKAWWPK